MPANTSKMDPVYNTRLLKSKYFQFCLKVEINAPKDLSPNRTVLRKIVPITLRKKKYVTVFSGGITCFEKTNTVPNNAH